MPVTGGGMTKNSDKSAGAAKPVVIEAGWGTFLLVWVKVIVLTAAIVLILKHVFKVPIVI